MCMFFDPYSLISEELFNDTRAYVEEQNKALRHIDSEFLTEEGKVAKYAFIILHRIVCMPDDLDGVVARYTKWKNSFKDENGNFDFDEEELYVVKFMKHYFRFG